MPYYRKRQRRHHWILRRSWLLIGCTLLALGNLGLYGDETQAVFGGVVVILGILLIAINVQTHWYHAAR